MFITLTHFENGKPVLVNVRKIRIIDTLSNGATRIVFDENHAIQVEEAATALHGYLVWKS